VENEVGQLEGASNVVVDFLPTIFERSEKKPQDDKMLAVVQGLPLTCPSLEESQKENSWCKNLV
jgi:hypothetical protein